MKKVALLVLVVWGLFYAAQKDMLPAWLPIPKMSSEAKLDIPPPSLGAPPAVSQPGRIKWQECLAADRLVEQGKTIEQSRAPFVLKEGGRVLSDSERIAVLQEKQKFLDDNNCADCLTPNAKCR